MCGVTRVDIRVCLRTNKIQYLFQDPTKIINEGEQFWMNAVFYTQQGAEKHYSKHLLK
jgi:hypothetical protein